MAVIDFTWTGAVSNNFGTNTNWSPTTRVPGTAGDKDNVFIPETAVNHILAGLDRTGDNAAAGNALGTVRVAYGSTVKVGAAGSYLRLVADLFSLGGLETFYLDSQHTTGDIDRIVVRSPNQFTALDLKGNAQLLQLVMLEGGAVMNFAGTVSAVDIDVGIAPTNPRLVVTAHGALPTYSQAGGFLQLNHTSGGPVIHKFGGYLETLGTGPITWLRHGGGRANLSSSGTGAVMTALAGLVDLTQGDNKKTWTFVDKFPGCEFLYNTARFAGTITDMAALGA